MKKLILFLFGFFLVDPTLAYIDPGSGMAFVSGIGAWIVALFAFMFGAMALTVKKWMAWIKNLLSRFRKKSSN